VLAQSPSARSTGRREHAPAQIPIDKPPFLRYTDRGFRPHPQLRSTAKLGLKLAAKRKKLLQGVLAVRDEDAVPVIRKVHHRGRAEPELLHGRHAIETNGRSVVVKYEPDPDLRDTERVPLLKEGGITAFIQREMLPYARDAWVDEGSSKIGYEISFNRYFYKPEPLRPLEEIRADILAVQDESEGLLDEILGIWR